MVCAGTYGVDDPRPVEPDARFHAGSIAKALAGLTVLDAARRGEIASTHRARPRARACGTTRRERS